VLVGLVVAAALAVASGTSSAADSTRTDVYAHLGRKVAVPAYEDLATSTTALQQAMTTLCASNTPQNLDAARAAWLDAWEAWNRTRVFRFGPPFVVSHITFPIDPAKIEALAAGSQPAIGPPFTADSLLQTGADVRGLESIEYVLFTGTVTPATCSLASASAELAASTAAEVLVAWTKGTGGAPPFTQQLANPKRSEMYDNEQQPLDDIVNGMLLVSSEATSALANTLLPTPGRSRATVHTGTRVQDNLAAVQAAWLGTTKAQSGEGIETLVESVSPTAAERVSETLSKAVKAAKVLPPRLADASPAQLRKTYKYVRQLTRQLDAEVATQLGVTVNLSDADGDS
jgi:predicted lipoprotein